MGHTITLRRPRQFPEESHLLFTYGTLWNLTIGCIQVSTLERKMCQRIYPLETTWVTPCCSEEKYHWESEDGLCSRPWAGQVPGLYGHLQPVLRWIHFGNHPSAHFRSGARKNTQPIKSRQWHRGSFRHIFTNSRFTVFTQLFFSHNHLVTEDSWRSLELPLRFFDPQDGELAQRPEWQVSITVFLLHAAFGRWRSINACWINDKILLLDKLPVAYQEETGNKRPIFKRPQQKSDTQWVLPYPPAATLEGCTLIPMAMLKCRPVWELLCLSDLQNLQSFFLALW